MIQNRNSISADKSIQIDHDVAARMSVKIIVFLRNVMTETPAKRIISIILIADGIPNDRVTELTGLCDRSVRELRKKIKDGKAGDELFHVGGGGREGKLKDIEGLIVEKIETNNYHTRQEIADMVYDEYGIKVHRTVVGKLLKKGIKRLKSGSLPAKADGRKQRRFYHAILKPLMDRAKKGEISLLFLDASYFVMGCGFLGYIYGGVRRFVKTFSGRKRYNVLGALDFISKKAAAVTNDSYITAREVCELFRKTAEAYVGKTVFAVLDNARYQQCAAARELAGQLGINLVFIPPYSPNLNLIERLWKFVKDKLRLRYYNQIEVFLEQIDSIISSTDNLNQEIADRLISEKVQLFDDLTAINENSFKRNQEAA